MRRRNRASIKRLHNNDVHRWTVSYADYMTLMFALFVVLYSVLLNKKDNYLEVIDAIQSAGAFTHTKTTNTQPSDLFESKNSVLDHNTVVNVINVTEKNIQVDNVNAELELTNIISENDIGSLSKLKLSLESVLAEELSSGSFNINLDQDWLTIEMTGPLLFAAGSHTLLNGAKKNISYIAHVLKPVKNMIRLRGYTDTKPISDEIYKSNWELSALRAISVLHSLNVEGIIGERMAIEGFGLYHPVLNEKGIIDDFKSRRVVIAISKYELFVEQKSDNNNNSNVKAEEKENNLTAPKPDSENIREVYLPDGRLIITTRQE